MNKRLLCVILTLIYYIVVRAVFTILSYIGLMVYFWLIPLFIVCLSYDLVLHRFPETHPAIYLCSNAVGFFAAWIMNDLIFQQSFSQMGGSSYLTFLISKNVFIAVSVLNCGVCLIYWLRNKAKKE